MNTPAEMELYEYLSDEVRMAVDALEQASQPVTINSIYTFLDRKIELPDIREVVNDLYPDVPETLVVCCGCRTRWCRGCVPDDSLFKGGM